jgi:hypothetical protein
VQRRAVQVEGVAERGEQGGGHGPRLLHARTRQHQTELVAADARQRAGTPDRVEQAHGDLP